MVLRPDILKACKPLHDEREYDDWEEVEGRHLVGAAVALELGVR